MNPRRHRLGTGLLTVLMLLSVVSVAATAAARTTSDGCVLRVWDDTQGTDEEVCTDSTIECEQTDDDVGVVCTEHLLPIDL